jgi:formylglycine-generating enzyme required for sulfatase activity
MTRDPVLEEEKGTPYHVVRGTCWDYHASYLVSANRCSNSPDYRNWFLSLRLVRTSKRKE